MSSPSVLLSVGEEEELQLGTSSGASSRLLSLCTEAGERICGRADLLIEQVRAYDFMCDWLTLCTCVRLF